jgi:2'-5' RNA ligase
VALAVCLLFDGPAERRLRALWARLEELGVPALSSHTHRRHVPHLSYAVLREWDLDLVRDTVEGLPNGGPLELHFDALGTFRRGRAWLVPATTTELATRQQRVVDALSDNGMELHRNYAPGFWTPHCTLAPRVELNALPRVAVAVNDILPLHARVDRAALVDSGNGTVHYLTNLP